MTIVQTIIRGAQLVALPWKNGGGVTREIAAGTLHDSNRARRAPCIDTFAWRVSVADVAQPGPFSRFDGVDRVLVLLSGAGMWLDERAEGGPSSLHGNMGRTHELLNPFDKARFAGEAAPRARLVDGPTRDLNLMTRRDAAAGDIDVWRGAGRRTVSGHLVLLFCAAGEMTVTVAGCAFAALSADDTLSLDARTAPHAGLQPLTVDVEGDGVLLAIRIQLHDATDAVARRSEVSS